MWPRVSRRGWRLPQWLPAFGRLPAENRSRPARRTETAQKLPPEAGMYGAEEASAERLVDLSTPLTRRSVAAAAHREGSRSSEGGAPLRRARDGDRGARAVSRDQARPRPGDGCRLLLRFLPAHALYSRKTSRPLKPRWRKWSRATSLSCANGSRATRAWRASRPATIS